MSRFECLFSSDNYRKKRKRFVDGIIDIDGNHVRIRAAGAESIVAFNGTLDSSTLSELQAEDEVQVGNLTVQLGSQVATPSSSQNSKQIQDSVAAVKVNLGVKSGESAPLVAPFKRPMISQNASIGPGSLVTHTTRNVPAVIPFKSPVSTGAAAGLSCRPSSLTGTQGSAMSSSVKVLASGEAPAGPQLSVPLRYQTSLPACVIPAKFSSTAEYCASFERAQREEIQGQIRAAMTRAEGIALATLRSSASSTGSRSGNKLCDRVIDKLHQGGFILRRVAVICSGDFKKSRAKQRKFEYNTSDDIDEDEQDDANDEDANAGENPKMYFKFEGTTNETPYGTDPYGKDDLWMLFSASPNAPPLRNTESSPESQSAYIKDKSRGYELPFHGGYTRRPVVLLRSMWHGLGSSGMLEVCSPEGESKPPTTVGNLPTGHTRGQLQGSFCAMRICSMIGTDLAAWDFLRAGSNSGGGEMPPQILRSLCNKDAITAAQELQRSSFRRYQSLTTSPLLPLLLGKAPTAEPLPSAKKFRRFNSETVDAEVATVSSKFHLNAEQCDVLRAVGRWFRCDEESSGQDNGLLVKGVFGAGKSHLLVALCTLIASFSSKIEKSTSSENKTRQKTEESQRVRCLLSAGTNVAVDTVLAQLPKHGVSVARVGSLARINPVLQPNFIFPHKNAEYAQREVLRLIQASERAAGRFGAGSGAETSALNDLLEAVKKRDFADSQEEKLRIANVVGVTCSSSSVSGRVPNIDILIIDEASQLSEPLAVLPLLASQACKVIIVGDPAQLPAPLSFVDTAATTGTCNTLHRTLFDRLFRLGSVEVIQLLRQYRCHERIANISSKLFYGGTLINGVSADSRSSLLRGLPATIACGPMIEAAEHGHEAQIGSSYSNAQEAEMIFELIKWISEGIHGNITVGVICLYKPQVSVVKSKIEGIETFTNVAARIGTVDAFQGSEFDVVILASTRSSYASSSFFNDSRRVNVALTRARCHFIFLGNLFAVHSAKLVWAQVLEHFQMIVSSVSELKSQVARCR